MEIVLSSIILSVAAVILYAMKLHSKKPKPFVHEHIWEPWAEGEEREKLNAYGNPYKVLVYKRQCIDCGLPEAKLYNLKNLYWEN